jgi:hypothetical protein
MQEDVGAADNREEEAVNGAPEMGTIWSKNTTKNRK